jgi:hypothetical protein
MSNHIVEPYKVFKKHKEILDNMECDLFRRMYLRNIYAQTSKILLAKSAIDIQGLKFRRWEQELNQEIYMAIKGYKLPLYIETY